MGTFQKRPCLEPPNKEKMASLSKQMATVSIRSCNTDLDFGKTASKTNDSQGEREGGEGRTEGRQTLVDVRVI